MYLWNHQAAIGELNNCHVTDTEKIKKFQAVVEMTARLAEK
jgi:hypothetical protein